MEINTVVVACSRQIELQAPESSNTAHLWINYALHKRAGDSGVHRIAALFKDPRARFNGFGLRGGNQRLRHGDAPDASIGLKGITASRSK